MVLRKFSLRFFAIFWWIGTITYICMTPIMLIDDEMTVGPVIVILLLAIGTFYLGRFLWNKSNRDSYSKTTGINKVDKTALFKVKSEVIHEPPHEILTEMRKNYSNGAQQGDLRILDDSISIMKSTKDIETFLSRSELALRTSLTLEQAQKADIHVSSNFLSSREIMDLKLMLLPNLLEKAYLKMSNEAAKLKTAKGQIGRYEKFANYLVGHEFELDISSNYERILSLTSEQISKLHSTINN